MKILKMSRSNIDIDQVVVSRQDMKLLEVLAGRVRDERVSGIRIKKGENYKKGKLADDEEDSEDGLE